MWFHTNAVKVCGLLWDMPNYYTFIVHTVVYKLHLDHVLQYVKRHYSVHEKLVVWRLSMFTSLRQFFNFLLKVFIPFLSAMTDVDHFPPPHPHVSDPKVLGDVCLLLYQVLTRNTLTNLVRRQIFQFHLEDMSYCSQHQKHQSVIKNNSLIMCVITIEMWHVLYHTHLNCLN